MNRYIAAGVLADMRAGKQVLVLSESLTLAAMAMLEVASPGLEPGESLRKTHGHERIEGATREAGTVYFRSIRSELRGLVADVVVVDAECYADQLDTIRYLVHTVGATRRMEVIHR